MTDRHGFELPYSTFIGDAIVDSYHQNNSDILDGLGVTYTEHGPEVDSTLSIPIKALMIWNSIDRDKMIRTSSSHFMDRSDELMVQWDDDEVRRNPDRVAKLHEQLVVLIEEYIVSAC